MDDEDDIYVVEDDGAGEGFSLFGDEPSSLGIDDSASTFDERLAEMAVAQSEDAEAKAFKETYSYDIAEGDFVTRGNAGVRLTDDLDVFAQWCQRALTTERGTVGIYGPDFGIDMADIRQGQVARVNIPDVLKDRISEALAHHNRFQRITDYDCELVDDVAELTFTINTSAGSLGFQTQIGV